MSAGSQWTFPGFQVIERPGARVLARPEAVPWVRIVLESGRGLHLASAGDRAALRLEGRNPVWVIPAKVSSESDSQTGTQWAVRHYARGGRFIPGLLGDRYFRSTNPRPYHETEASETARSRGVPTPRVVAAALYPSGLFYRADLVTEFIPDASDMVDALFDTRRKGAGGAGERLDALQAAGNLIRKMGGAGLGHRDLHAGNILLQWEGAAPRAFLLDLDRCEIGPVGKAKPTTAMHRRLCRSLKKWERQTGIRISEKEWQTLEQAVAV